MCAEHCARLGPGGRSGARPGPPPQPKQQQLAGEAKDVEAVGPSPNAAAGAAEAEADMPKASPEARPQIPTKPRVPGKPQELASPPASRPTPAPRRASESTAPTPPTPRPRSSLQHENLAEPGGSSVLVNGEQRSSWGQTLPGTRLAFKCTHAWGCASGRTVCACVYAMCVAGLTVVLRLLLSFF